MAEQPRRGLQVALTTRSLACNGVLASNRVNSLCRYSFTLSARLTPRRGDRDRAGRHQEPDQRAQIAEVDIAGDFTRDRSSALPGAVVEFDDGNELPRHCSGTALSPHSGQSDLLDRCLVVRGE